MSVSRRPLSGKSLPQQPQMDKLAHRVPPPEDNVVQQLQFIQKAMQLMLETTERLHNQSILLFERQHKQSLEVLERVVRGLNQLTSLPGSEQKGQRGISFPPTIYNYESRQTTGPATLQTNNDFSRAMIGVTPPSTHQQVINQLLLEELSQKRQDILHKTYIYNKRLENTLIDISSMEKTINGSRILPEVEAAKANLRVLTALKEELHQNLEYNREQMQQIQATEAILAGRPTGGDMEWRRDEESLGTSLPAVTAKQSLEEFLRERQEMPEESLPPNRNDVEYQAYPREQRPRQILVVKALPSQVQMSLPQMINEPSNNFQSLPIRNSERSSVPTGFPNHSMNAPASFSQPRFDNYNTRDLGHQRVKRHPFVPAGTKLPPTVDNAQCRSKNKTMHSHIQEHNQLSKKWQVLPNNTEQQCTNPFLSKKLRGNLHYWQYHPLVQLQCESIRADFKQFGESIRGEELIQYFFQRYLKALLTVIFTRSARKVKKTAFNQWRRNREQGIQENSEEEIVSPGNEIDEEERVLSAFKEMFSQDETKDDEKEGFPNPNPQMVTATPQPHPVQQQSNAPVNFPSRMALVPFEQKDIIIEIDPLLLQASLKAALDLESAKLALSKWIGQVFDVLSRETFNGYFSHHLTYPEARVYFTHNMALNFQHMVECFWDKHRRLWEECKGELIEHYEDESLKALEFMMVKYPQKRKAHVNEELMTAIPAKDDSEDPKLDLIRNTGLFFSYDAKKQLEENRRSYYRNIKLLLNKLMQESQAQLPRFRELMRELFTVRQGSNTHQLKNLVGMKFKENTPHYTEKELEEDGMQIKAPEVLRIIIKWISQLEKKVRNLGTGAIIHNLFTVREPTRVHSDYLNSSMKEKLEKQMAENMDQLELAEKQMRLRIRSTLSLFPQYVASNLDHFPYVHPNQVKSGLLSLVMSETVSNLSVNYLTFIIHLLEKSFSSAKEYDGRMSFTRSMEGSTHIVTQIRQYKDFQLVSFTISDLLRCKCTGSLQEIRQVWAKLSNHEQLKVYRVKNRLDTSNRDFLVNVQLTGTPLLCEIQLAVTEKVADDEKGTYLNKFSHFFYELSRASYGPIAEAVIIKSYLTDFSKFFGQALAKKPYQRVHTQSKVEKGLIEINGYIQRRNNFTFICSKCRELRIASQRHLPNFQSCPSVMEWDKDAKEFNGLRKTICGDCAVSSLDNNVKSSYFLEEFRLDKLFQPIDSVRFSVDTIEQSRVICAVKKASSIKKPLILQSCVLSDKQTIFVPVFYEHIPNRKCLKPDALVEGYDLFGLRRGFEKLTKLSSEFEQVKNLIFATSMPMSLTQPVLMDAIAFKDSIMLLDLHHTNESLAKLINKGREFKKYEIDLLKKKSLWKFEASNLDESSFDLDMFKQDISYVHQIKLASNYLTGMRFMISQSLKILDLSRNNIKHLEVTEQDFPSLQKLNLSENSLAEIVVLKHPSLTSLVLSKNKLNSIPGAEYWQLPRLETLSLRENNLTEIDLSKYKCQVLSNLDLCNILAYHSVQQDSEIYVTKQYDTTLSTLADNQLTVLSLDAVRAAKLSVLDLSNNKLHKLTLPPLLENLSKLCLQSNLLEVLDLCQYTLLGRLGELNIDNNKISMLVLPIEMVQLTTLKIGVNKMQQVKLHEMNNLCILDIRSSNLEEITLPRKLPHLRSLTITNSRLTSLNLRTSMPNLEFMCIEDNKVKNIVLPSNLSCLKQLTLKNNSLTSLPLQGKKMPLLEKLCLNGNMLTSLVFTASLPKLMEIDLRNNKLKTASFEAEAFMPALRKLYLGTQDGERSVVVKQNKDLLPEELQVIYEEYKKEGEQMQ